MAGEFGGSCGRSGGRRGRGGAARWRTLTATAAASALAGASACRHAVYASSMHQASAAMLAGRPSHGLVAQSCEPADMPWEEHGAFFDAEVSDARNPQFHQDGWGLGWFEGIEHSGRGEPQRWRSENGATQGKACEKDPELIGLSQMVHSKLLFAHVRAASDGDTHHHNSHPFIFNQVLYMHNGGCPDKEGLLDFLDQREVDVLTQLKGSTDSEYAGALMAKHLGDVCNRHNFTRSELRDAVIRTVLDLDSLSQGADAQHSSLNFAVSDGRFVLLTRFRTDRNQDPPSLYFTLGDRWDSATERMVGAVVPHYLDGDERLNGAKSHDDGKVVGTVLHGNTFLAASEPLSSSHAGWTPVAKDQMLLFDRLSGTLEAFCLSPSCRSDIEHRCRRSELACPINSPLVGSSEHPFFAVE